MQQTSSQVGMNDDGYERQPGKAAWKGSLERQPGKAAWKGSLERQPGKAAWKGSLERQPGKAARKDRQNMHTYYTRDSSCVQTVGKLASVIQNTEGNRDPA